MSRSTRPAATVTTDTTPDGWELTLTGEFDIGNLQTLRATLDPLLARRPEATVVLDVAGVRFMDSATLAVLVQASAKGARVRLRNPSPIIEAIVNASGLTDVLVLER